MSTYLLILLYSRNDVYCDLNISLILYAHIVRIVPGLSGKLLHQLLGTSLIIPRDGFSFILYNIRSNFFSHSSPLVSRHWYNWFVETPNGEKGGVWRTRL